MYSMPLLIRVSDTVDSPILRAGATIMKHKHQQLKTPHDNAYKSDIRQRSLSLHRPGIVWERFTRNKVAVVALLTIAALGIAAILAPALTHQSRTADPANDTH